MKEKGILIAILILATILRFGIGWNLMIGLGSVVGVWYLTGQVFEKQKWFKEITVLFIAVSSWHINLPLKASMGIFGVVWGALILIKFLKGKWLYLSVVLLIFLGSQIISPLVINLDNVKDTVWLTDQQRREHGKDYNGFVSKIFHNKAVNYSLSFIEHWGEHFSGDFLFITSPRVTNLFILGNKPLMYLFDILFLGVGLFTILKKGEWDKWGVILVWLGLAPINSALNFAPPDNIKASLMVVPLIIISGYGVVVLVEGIQMRFKRYTIK